LHSKTITQFEELVKTNVLNTHRSNSVVKEVNTISRCKINEDENGDGNKNKEKDSSRTFRCASAIKYDAKIDRGKISHDAPTKIDYYKKMITKKISEVIINIINILIIIFRSRTLNF